MSALSSCTSVCPKRAAGHVTDGCEPPVRVSYSVFAYTSSLHHPFPHPPPPLTSVSFKTQPM